MSGRDTNNKSSMILPFLLGIIVGSNTNTIKKCLEPFIKGAVESISAFSKASTKHSEEQKEWLEDIIAESIQVDKLEK